MGALIGVVLTEDGGIGQCRVTADLHHRNDIDLDVHILVGEVGHRDAGGGSGFT